MTEKYDAEDLTVSVKTMTVNGRRMSKTFLFQVQEEKIIDEDNLKLRGTPWGFVRIPAHGGWREALVWELNGEIRRCARPEPINWTNRRYRSETANKYLTKCALEWSHSLGKRDEFNGKLRYDGELEREFRIGEILVAAEMSAVTKKLTSVTRRYMSRDTPIEREAREFEQALIEAHSEFEQEVDSDAMWNNELREELDNEIAREGLRRDRFNELILELVSAPQLFIA